MGGSGDGGAVQGARWQRGSSGSVGTQSCPCPLPHPPNCIPPNVLNQGKTNPTGLCWGSATPQGPQPALGWVQAPSNALVLLEWEIPASPLGCRGCVGPRAAPGPTCSCSAACGSRWSAAAAASPAGWWTGSSPAAAARCVMSGSAPAAGAQGSVGVTSRGHTMSPVSLDLYLPGTQSWYLCTPVH